MGNPLEDHLQERFEEVAGGMIEEIQGMIKSKSYLNIFRDNDVDYSVSFTKTVVLHLFCQDLIEKEYWDLAFEIPVIVFNTYLALLNSVAIFRLHVTSGFNSVNFFFFKESAKNNYFPFAKNRKHVSPVFTRKL